MKQLSTFKAFAPIALLTLAGLAQSTLADGVYVRFKIEGKAGTPAVPGIPAKPGVAAVAARPGHAAVAAVPGKPAIPGKPRIPGDEFIVTTGGWRHDGPKNWYLPSVTGTAEAAVWSEWIDAGSWDLHRKLDRAGSIAEWPAMKLTVVHAKDRTPVIGCHLDIQLADEPNDASVVATIHETSGSNTVAFLLPHPLREHANEIETGSEMAARHLKWATEAAGGQPAHLKKFDLITSIWGHYDPLLAREETKALQQLGFNVIGGVSEDILRNDGLRTYGTTSHLMADPEQSAASWKSADSAHFNPQVAKGDALWELQHLSHVVITDEIQTMDFRPVNKAKLDGWFHAYLKDHGQTEETLGKPIDKIEYPAAEMYQPALPEGGDLTTRKIDYFAAKFGQWWTVKQLKQTTDLLHTTLPGVKTETLPADHAFFDAWGPPHVGMSDRNLDLFEIGHQQAVDIISTEDWLGLNHMYGPNNTWSGGQSHGYLASILRSGIGENPVALRTLITPSDDNYLRLKAYSAVGQGAKSIFFWTFGPTFIGTENYWSDLRSEYDGVAKLSRALAKSEDVLYPAKVVHDPVAILYSVSNDIWSPKDPAAFVETRLTWHALRHLSVQPDFLREEDVEAGRLKDYKVLYVCGQSLTRNASAAVDAWVKQGGVVYLSAGAATRDEFFEPYMAPFAAAVWPADAATHTVHDTGHVYNERKDLPGIKPLTTANVAIDKSKPFEINVIGTRLDIKPDVQTKYALHATFADGKTAAVDIDYGKGRIVAVGFMPGLAYSPFKEGQTTLSEVWQPQPREIFALPLAAASIHPAAEASVPVVEANLLDGPAGAALVLANYTYKPIQDLKITLRNVDFKGKPVSTEGATIKMTPGEQPGTVVLEMPLTWTDIVVLPAK